MEKSSQIANILMDKKAVTINATEPYTYVSGIRSPIYCDNRRLMYYPEERKAITTAFVDKIKELNPDIIAGTASSAICWAAWIADELQKPMVYVRKKSKGYGQNKLIEGGDIDGKKVVVVEDLVSTGGSSVNAVESCRLAGADVIAMIAIFTYEFEKARKKFEEAKCDTFFLTTFSELTKVAAENNIVDTQKLDLVQSWNADPAGWGPKNGFPNAEPKN
ncbi:orotate phosphoribosyltransferase [Candidatus Woesearchaeota archaeon]|nr:orotate phosphoribosyltransferase [Candidatus Woesearchaeota archaeon]